MRNPPRMPASAPASYAVPRDVVVLSAINENKKRRRRNAAPPFHLWNCTVCLLGLALLSQLLNLLPLRFDLTLLLIHLRLSLRIGVFLVLHRVADYVAGTAAQNATDCSARQRMAHGRADDRAGTRANRGAAERSLLTS